MPKHPRQETLEDMKCPTGIPLLRANGELLPGNPFSRVILSSAGTKWNNIVAEQHQVPSNELADLMYMQHVITVNVGRPITCEFKRHRRFRRVFKKKGAISLFPSRQSFFRRLKEDAKVFADVLYVALDPVFMSRTAEELELNPDRIELVEQRRGADPALRHIALALRAGVQSGAAGDLMYGEALSTALAVHLLREYGGAAAGLKRPHLRPCWFVVKAASYQRTARSSKRITTSSINIFVRTQTPAINSCSDQTN
jgi:hypothetical protein